MSRLRTRIPKIQVHGDVLGVGLGDFVPWLNVVSSAAGALTGGGDKDKKAAQEAQAAAIKKALEEEKVRRAKEAAEAKARTMQLVLFGFLGLTVVGTGAYLLARRK
jgi:hypothetical protein